MDSALPESTNVAKNCFVNELAADAIRAYVKQIVRIHHLMFEKLLCENDDMTLELAELLEDAGETYLQIAKRITERNSSAPL
jgi:hypothetical protein